jgi:hypothetical protein
MDINERKTLIARKQQALDDLVERCRDLRCQVCGQTGWQANGVFALAPPANVVAEFTPSIGPNIAILQCTTCGHVLLFDAKAAGAEVRE